MNIVVIVNPKSGSSAKFAEARAKLESLEHVTFHEPSDDESHPIDIDEFVRNGATLLVAAGGDGTVSSLVNLVADAGQSIPIAIIPLGTGNDLARTLNLTLEPLADCQAFLRSKPKIREIDLIRTTIGGTSRWLINAATGGFSGQVATDTTSEVKRLWGPLAYLRGAVGVAADPTTYSVTLTIDDQPPRKIEVLNLVVANGQTAAGGVMVAPKASLEDGKIDLIIVRPGTTFDHTVVTARLMAGEYLDDEHVQHTRAHRIEIHSEPAMPFSLDGELIEESRFRFECVPKRLRIVVGKGYRPHRRGIKGFGKRLLGGVANSLSWVGRLVFLDRGGLGLALAAIVVFALLAYVVAGQLLLKTETHILSELREWGTPTRTAIAQVVTRIVSAWEYTVLVAGATILLALRRRNLDLVILLASVAGGLALEWGFKGLFAIARPVIDERLTPALGYSFPSGHALRATVFFGIVAGLIVMAQPKQRWRWIVGGLLLLFVPMIAFSRVYLQVHYPSDVIAGMLVGTAWVLACLNAHRRIRNRSPRVD